MLKWRHPQASLTLSRLPLFYVKQQVHVSAGAAFFRNLHFRIHTILQHLSLWFAFSRTVTSTLHRHHGSTFLGSTCRLWSSPSCVLRGCANQGIEIGPKSCWDFITNVTSTLGNTRDKNLNLLPELHAACRLSFLVSLSRYPRLETSAVRLCFCDSAA